MYMCVYNVSTSDVLLIWGLSLNLELTDLVSLAVTGLQETVCLFLPSTRVLVYIALPALVRFLDIELGSSCLHSRLFTYCTISPASLSHFFGDGILLHCLGMPQTYQSSCLSLLSKDYRYAPLHRTCFVFFQLLSIITRTFAFFICHIYLILILRKLLKGKSWQVVFDIRESI